MAKLDPQVLAHLEWLGFVQPTGLVVSAPALVRAGAILNRADVEGQRKLAAVAEDTSPDTGEDPQPYLWDFEDFAKTVLDWKFSPKYYAGTDGLEIPESLELALPEYGETLRPDYAVRERDAAEGELEWQLLIRVLETGTDFDKVAHGNGKLEASEHGRLERLLRHTGVPAGLLFNGHVIRLMSAPRGESSGWLDFNVADMLTTTGRPICSALRLLLSQQRLLGGAKEKRLSALLSDSRKYQNEVSERLAEQVLHALYELLRGLQAAHDASGHELLREVMREDPDRVYRGLLTVLLRMVFLLYAEERGMLPDDEAYAKHYSVSSLHDRLREEAALHPDTMDQRFGAWAQLLVLFRMVYDGAHAGGLDLPQRHGVLFEPDRYPFLEGRGFTALQIDQRIPVPLVPDGAVFRALDNLLILDGERISYRALDVEQIGSVYETMMGFRIETATGISVAIKAPKKGGAPTTINLEVLLEQSDSKRAKWIQDQSGRKLTPTIVKLVKEASSLEAIHAALENVIDRCATPDLVSVGAVVLQPSEARRKSGSHYTPRTLTEPIVRTALRPVLERLRKEAGGIPAPDAILEFKICDPAMGSGAFLVEACRQLGDELIEAWNAHNARPEIPPDEDEVIHARRIVAQRCLYGVDRNPVAVDLAKVSLWLATLARDHAFTFVDHALCHGDSLVGLTNEQIAARSWERGEPLDSPNYRKLKARVDQVAELRRGIRAAGDSASDTELRGMLEEVEEKGAELSTCGDLVVEAFFSGSKRAERAANLGTVTETIASGDLGSHAARLEDLKHQDPPLVPFHWALVYPEVFDRENSGFDAFVGNPPFMRGKAIGTMLGECYRDYLTETTAESNASADLVSFFFRRAFAMLRDGGTLGLIATKTISKGDTRRAGLRYICNNGGTIYAARRRVRWPGLAAVIVSTLHVLRGTYESPTLDGAVVPKITAFLFTRGDHEDPVPLAANANISFNGCALAGVGFTFDDRASRATPVARLRQLESDDPKVSERVFPFLGGDEINASPNHASQRYVIFFNGMSLEEAARWPRLLEIVRERVKPERDRANRRQHREKWWQFGDWRPGLFSAIADKDRMLCVVFVSQYLGFAWVPTDRIVSHNVGVFASDKDQLFCVLQSRVHELFATQLSSGLEDRPGYRPSDGFLTFPFPQDWESDSSLEQAGKAYYDLRAAIMNGNDEGLTKTCSRFHDPDEHDQDMLKLRELHVEMDRAVLGAFGWRDVDTTCEFLLDYEIDEEEWGKKKKPWRYRWPDDVRDEVLARLLELNAQRAEEERSEAKSVIAKDLFS